MKEKIQLLAAALALILLLCGCAARGTASNDAKPAAGDVTDSNAAPYEVPLFGIPSSTKMKRPRSAAERLTFPSLKAASSA